MFEVEGFSFGQVVDDILALLILEILYPCTVAGADIIEVGYYGSIHIKLVRRFFQICPACMGKIHRLPP